MRMQRGPDGVPMQAPAPPRREPASAAPPGHRQRPGPADDPMPDTVPVDRARWDVPTDFNAAKESRGDEYTRVHRPGGSARPGADAGGDAADAMADPPAGWLVIVDGPGRGRAVTLGMHHNPIGRDAANRVALDHGDETISRLRHLVVTYDPEGRRFYVTPGGGTNLCYVNDQPVLASMPLDPGARIRTGRTTLRFVPLCGPDFTWDAVNGGDSAAAADARDGADAGDA